MSVRTLRLAFSLSATLLIVSICVTPSLAARGHEYSQGFGEVCLLEPCEGAALKEPGGVAVDEATRDVYVVDKGANRVVRFNKAGEYQSEFNGSGTLLNGKGEHFEGKAAGSGGLPEEVPSGQFDEPEGIAVDNSCAQRHLAEPTCKEEDPSDGDVYVVDTKGHTHGSFEEERMVIDKFSASGAYIGQITRNLTGEEFSEEGFQRLYGVAVDPRGEVWVEGHNFGNLLHTLLDGATNYTNAVHNERIGFRDTEDLLSTLAAPGFAVDAEDNLYVRNTAGRGNRLAKFNSKGDLLSPELDEEAPAANGVAVEASSANVYVAHAGSVNRLDASAVSPEEHPGAVSLERLRAPGTSSFGGVAVNASTLTVYAAEPALSRIDVFSPEAPRRPTIQVGSESVFDVSATSASFTAEINPRSEENEAATSYAFRYGPCDSAAACSSSPYPQSAPAPEGSLAANYEPDPVSAHPQDLAPHTVYHMSLFARNSHGEEHGEEVIFTTQGTGAAPLPDNRHWELVSPPDKHGAVLKRLGLGTTQAAASGDAITYLANAPTETDAAGFSEGVQVLSRRTPGSWQSKDIATPHEVPVGIDFFSQVEYQFFSEDLTSAIVYPFGPFTQETSPQASEQTLYLRKNFPAGEPSNPCSSSCYRPLVSGCPGGGEPCPSPVEEVANVPEGTKFGKQGGGPIFRGASPDASHVVLSARAKLTEDAPAEGTPGAGNGSLYEWAGGKLALLSVLPSSQPAPAPALGSFGAGERIARHAISANGQRVIFSAGVLDAKKEHLTEEHHLYLRDVAREVTIALDTPEAACTAKGKCKGISQPVFQDASADDSRIFFTDPRPLTQSSGGSDLYECEIEEAEEELSCKLSDLSETGTSEEAGVLGLMAGASEDGSAIYFTANGKLTTEASARGEEAVAGDCQGNTAISASESITAVERCNLYERSGGQTRLIAVLSGADFPDWSLRETSGLSGLADRVSPSGSYLAFSSRRPLSGYDNRDVQSGKPDQEVFLYDSQSNTLVCASCDPSGGRPHGVQYKQIDLASGFQTWPEGTWIAASTPGWSAIDTAEGFALHQSRYLNDAGRLFFNSAEGLVPQDSNKTEDVYQYEPPAVGDCSSSQSTFGAASGGCVALISSGQAKEESAFLDASESGDDAFFLTGQRLLPSGDLDQSLDVYDAHACSSGSPCLPEAPTPPPACEGDACQSPGAPPENPTPSSLTYQGPGNPTPPGAVTPKHKSAAELKAEKLKAALKSCKAKSSKRKRQTCETQARRKSAPARKVTKSNRRSK